MWFAHAGWSLTKASGAVQRVVGSLGKRTHVLSGQLEEVNGKLYKQLLKERMSWSDVVVSYLKNNVIKQQGQSVYVIGGTTFKQNLVKNGIKVINKDDNSEDLTDEMGDIEFKNYHLDPQVAAVVVSQDYSFNFRKHPVLEFNLS